jgi:hypothetical protein
MLDAVSSALSGLSAANRRFDAVANNSFNEETRGAGGPSPSGPTGGAGASGGLGGPAPEDPRAVDETASSGRGSAASLRSTTPSYLSSLDPSVEEAEEDSNSAAVNPDVEAAEDDEANLDGSDSGAALEIQARSEADQQAIRVTNELVRRLYDLG